MNFIAGPEIAGTMTYTPGSFKYCNSVPAGGRKLDIVAVHYEVVCIWGRVN